MAELYPGFEAAMARLPGVQAEVTDIAQDLASRARVRAGQHRDSGKFGSSIRVTRSGRGKDRLVENTDPLAWPKEFGHALVRNGRQIGYVRGIHVMRGAYDSMPGVSGD